jgi:hypothetical protein
MKPYSIIQTIIAILAIGLGGHNRLGYAVECPEPRLSTQQIIDIVQKERAARTDLPKEIPNGDKLVSPAERCYYLYQEFSKEYLEDKYTFIFNKDGVIVDILLHHAGTRMKCPLSDPSLEFLADRLRILREREPELPKLPSLAYKTSIVKYGCAFYYAEESDDEIIRQTFIFDAFGDLIDYMSRLSE